MKCLMFSHFQRMVFDLAQSAADLSTDDPTDFDGGTSKPPRPTASELHAQNKMHEARLYDTWWDLVLPQRN